MNHRHKGFSLVEIVVGLGIGMISMVVIMQVFAVFEGGKRTTTAGADAQNNGAIALFMIEQDARMAGWGMETSIYSGCTNTYTYCDGNASCGGTVGPLPELAFASLRLADGGDAPDSITAQYFTAPGESAFTLPRSTTVQKTMPQSSSILDVASVSGCKEGDLLLVSQAGNCTLMQVTQVIDSAGARKLQHNPGADGPFNPPASYQNANGWPAYSSGAKATCFAAPKTNALYYRGYSINPTTKQLVRTQYDPETEAEVNEVIASEIMDLQIQYGIAPAGGSQVVDSWADASGPTWGNPAFADTKRIKALRIALVARSTQYERPESGSCKITTPEMVAEWSSWAEFNTDNYPDDWQCYRYKVFETVVPLRNVLWGNL